MMKRFASKVAVVTGGSGGLGAASATRLAREGAKVVIADLRDASELAEQLRSEGLDATSAVADITDPEQVEELFRFAEATYGGIDVLHANAGMVGSGEDGLVGVEELSLDFWDQTFAVNVRGTMLTIKAAVPRMIAGGGGAIVITSSIASFFGENVRSAYSASKAALNSLTRHVATAYGRQGIRCNALAPGLMRQTLENAAPDTVAWSRHVPYTPIAVFDEVAPVVAFLASEDSRYITGQTIVADGGFTTHYPSWADGGHVSSR